MAKGLIYGLSAVASAAITSQDDLTGAILATSDPTTTTDSAAGYNIGSVIINTTNSRIWICQSNTAGAATWLLSGIIPGTGSWPSSITTLFGGGTGSFKEEGNINVQLASVAAPVNPGATGADNVLAVYSIPASSFDAAGRGVQIYAAGNFAATNNSKNVKLILNPSAAVVGSTITGGTTIATTGALTTTANNVGWSLAGSIFKRGAAASNTQLAVSGGAIAGAAHLGLSLCADLTATESGAILVAVTGNAVTATTDIGLSLFQVSAMN